MPDFLSSGEQTQIIPRIKEIADSLEGESINYIFNALLWIAENLKPKPENINMMDVFRKRTSIQIIEDSYHTGCTDIALVFISLCRAKGIATKYVETIRESWLENPTGRTIKGHIFAECLIDGKWYVVNPQSGTIHTKRNYRGFVIYKIGLDSWDLDIVDFESLKRLFVSFAKDYNSEPKK